MKINNVSFNVEWVKSCKSLKSFMEAVKSVRLTDDEKETVYYTFHKRKETKTEEQLNEGVGE